MIEFQTFFNIKIINNKRNEEKQEENYNKDIHSPNIIKVVIQYKKIKPTLRSSKQ